MAIALALPALGVMCVILIALLIAYAVEGTVGALLQWVAKQLDSATIHIPYVGSFNPFGPLITILNAAADELHVIVAGLIAANAWAFHVFVRANAYAWQELSAALGDLADGTSQTLEWMWRHGFASLIGDALIGPLADIKYLLGGFHQLAKDAAEWVAHPERIITKEIGKAVAPAAAIPKIIYRDIPVVVSKAVAIPWGAIHGVERDVSGIEKWIRSHVKDLTEAGLAGVVIAVLAKEFSWLQCKNNANIGKHFCGWPVKALEDLLGGVLDYLAISNLCLLLTEMDKLATAMLPYIEQGTTAIDSLIKCQKSTVAGPIPLSRTAVTAPWTNLAL